MKKSFIKLLFISLLSFNIIIEVIANDNFVNKNKQSSKDQVLLKTLMPILSTGIFALLVMIVREVRANKFITNFQRFSQPVFGKINDQISQDLKLKNLDDPRFKKIIISVQKTFGSKIEQFQKELQIIYMTGIGKGGVQVVEYSKITKLADLIADFNIELIRSVRFELPSARKYDFDFFKELYAGLASELSKPEAEALLTELENKKGMRITPEESGLTNKTATIPTEEIQTLHVIPSTSATKSSDVQGNIVGVKKDTGVEKNISSDISTQLVFYEKPRPEAQPENLSPKANLIANLNTNRPIKDLETLKRIFNESSEVAELINDLWTQQHILYELGWGPHPKDLKNEFGLPRFTKPSNWESMREYSEPKYVQK